MSDKAKRGKFYLDCLGTGLKGWTFGDTWNCWECPSFEKAEVEEMIRLVGEAMATSEPCDGFPLIAYNADLDAYVVHMSGHEEEDPDIFDGFDISTTTGVKHVYAIGSHGWCWQKDE